MAILIVEQSFEVPLTDEEHDRVAKRLNPCLDQHGARRMRSYLSVDRKRLLCEFEAADAEAVRASFRGADVPFDRVWTAGWLYKRE
jgi:hypothetical protein